MKKSILAILFTALVLVGCEDVTEIYVDNPTTQLEVSSNRVIFDSDGGTRTVLVATDLDWGYSFDAAWLTISKGDGALVIVADVNDAASQRYADVVLTGTNGAVTLSETISVAQRISDDNTIDLSDGETANCYIVNTGTSYRFNATVKGNGLSTEGAAEAYIKKYGATIDPAEIVYADLLWEAALDADKTRSREIIDNAPIYSNGYVYFTSGPAEGNAVIAVKNAVGTILWSWHIWVTDAEISEIVGNGFYWMDRNLGALTTAEEDVNNRGLLYQWGRKDPFLPSSAPYGAQEQNVRNIQVGDGSGVWDYDSYSTKLASEAPGNIPLAVESPMTMLLINGITYSWYITKMNSDNYFNYLWGNSSNLSKYVKSMFDPCPAGYNVPVDNPWISSKDQDVNYWSVNAPYGRYWTGGNNAYYPCAGAFNGSTGEHIAASTYGYYWTSGIYSSTSYLVTDLYFTPATGIYYSSTYPVHAMSVRCMRVE